MDRVQKYKTFYKEGFTYGEINELLKQYPNINKEDFYNKLGTNTCLIKEDTGQIVTFRRDVESCILCCLENRELTVGEFD